MDHYIFSDCYKFEGAIRLEDKESISREGNNVSNL